MVIGSMTMNPDTTKPDGAVGATALAANPYGYYDPSSREYVITRPDTPTPWINYLGQGRYGGIISNTAGGFSFDRDPRDRRVSRYHAFLGVEFVRTAADHLGDLGEGVGLRQALGHHGGEIGRRFAEGI